MDRAKIIAKVDDVECWRSGQNMMGTLHLSAHHFIFRYEPTPTDSNSPPQKIREMWITYPIISYCTYKPSPPASHQPPSIRLRCRDFMFIAFKFLTDKEARAVYDTIRSCTCKLGTLEKLLAFTYQGVPREKKVDGWGLYDPRREFARQGISPKSAEKGWRFTEINKDYSPMVGVRGNRSAQDEKLVAAIWSTNKPARSSHLKSAPATPRASQSTSDLSELAGRPSGDEALNEKQSVDISGEASESDLKTISDGTASESGELPRVYGAQQSNLIVDARPTVNAYAMQAVGMGTENMENYKGAIKEYYGIDNIHVMRKSLNDVIDMLKESDYGQFKLQAEKLEKMSWLKHISLLVDGGLRIARQVGILHSHVLIHCSDGWDRTSQLSSLAQICLDPYFRTIDGFVVLVEKDWLSFGHMFRHRTGHLSSEKWFEIENERIANDRANMNGTQPEGGAGGGGGNAFENALSKAQSLFKKNQNPSDDSDSDEPPYSGFSSKRTYQAEDQKYQTKVKETSPVFHQFLDATYQIMHQYPTRFEFNERFLRRLLYHVYACQYGTFLFDNERERVEWKAKERTRSVWDYLLSRREEFLNKEYDAEVDDHVQGKERIILPVKEKMRWWAEMFGRTDEEMNPVKPSINSNSTEQTYAAMRGPEINEPVVTGVESAEGATGVGSTRHPPPVPSMQAGFASQGQEALNAGLARLGIGRGDRSSPSPSRPRSPRTSREVMEVEMQ